MTNHDYGLPYSRAIYVCGSSARLTCSTDVYRSNLQISEEYEVWDCDKFIKSLYLSKHYFFDLAVEFSDEHKRQH